MGKRKTLAGVVVLPVFNVEVGVFRTVKDFRKYLAKRDCDVELETRADLGQARWDEGNDGLTWWSVIVTDEATDATMVHECVHMADFIMDRLGIPTGVENTEIRCLLTAELYLGVKEALGR